MVRPLRVLCDLCVRLFCVVPSPSARNGCQKSDATSQTPNTENRTPSTSEETPLDTRNASGYIASMIKRFRHRGLERYFTKGSKAGMQANHEKRVRLILARLNASTSPRDMNLPGLGLHELTGNRKGTWAVSVSGNWRMTFSFEGEDVMDVDYEDYH